LAFKLCYKLPPAKDGEGKKSILRHRQAANKESPHRLRRSLLIATVKGKCTSSNKNPHYKRVESPRSARSGHWPKWCTLAEDLHQASRRSAGAANRLSAITDCAKHGAMTLNSRMTRSPKQVSPFPSARDLRSDSAGDLVRKPAEIEAIKKARKRSIERLCPGRSSQDQYGLNTISKDKKKGHRGVIGAREVR